MVRYVNPADYNPKRITNSGKYFAKRFNFKDIKFSVQIRDIQKIEKKQRILLALTFLVMKIK